MDRPHVLAVDLGTSGPKAALVSVTGEVVAPQFEPVMLQLYDHGGAEQDPDEWWTTLTAAARRAVDEAPVTAEDIAAVCVTSQWSGTVAVDAGGNAIDNAIIWMDSRGAPYIRNLIGGPVRVEGYDPRKLRTWIQLTGGAPSRSGKDPIAHILWLEHERPEIATRASLYLEPKDYLNLRLTGRTSATFDSIALHWVTDNRDPDTVTYDDGLLARAGLDRTKLPDLIRATDILGPLLPEAAAALGVPAGIPVVAGTPDLHSAAVGSGATRDGHAHLYLGTSSWLICHVPFKRTDILHNIGTLPSAIPGRYLTANEQETAGKALEWLAGILYPDRPDRAEVYDDMNRIAAGVPPGSQGAVFTPWLYGERTPVEDSTLRGGFFNQGLDTGRAEMIRAVFEGVAYNTRWLLGHLERFARGRLDPIVAVGGGARSDLWCQIHADVLGRTIRQADDPLQVNVRGAGLIGHVALGNITFDQVPSLVPIRATYRPDPASGAVYDELYDAFRGIHRGARRVYRKLNRQTGGP